MIKGSGSRTDESASNGCWLGWVVQSGQLSVSNSHSGLETNARPPARGELNSVRASGSSDLTSPVGEWTFYGDLSTMNTIL